VNALYDASGRPLPLGERLGRGGEGSVFAVTGGYVAKIYTNGGAATHARKLEILAGLPDEPVRAATAWPTALVYDRDHRIAGFVMPRLDGFAAIASAANPSARKQAFPQAGWSWLAHVGRNLAIAVQSVHDAGFVIGDLNESNVLVASDARVRLIDVDSFQVQSGGTVLACDVGTPMYQPPELQGKPFGGLVRTPNHDRFGLAVLVFQLLFMGRHPWAGRRAGRGELSFENGEYIARLPYAYGPAAASAGFRPPEDGVRLDWLPPQTADLFERAFGPEGRRGRPAGPQWVEALDGLQRALVRCRSAVTHQYPHAMARCPWCRFDRAGFLFFIVGSPATVRESLDVVALEEQLRVVRSDLFDLPVAVEPRRVAVVGEPVEGHLVRHARLWYAEIATSGLAAFAAAHWLALTWALAVTAALVIAIIATRPPLGPVRSVRRKRLAEAQQRYDEAYQTQQRIVDGSRIPARKRELADMLARYKALPGKYQAERQALDRDRYRLQLEAFLDTAFVEDVSLWKIGRRTRAVLAAFGIETAKDVEQRLPSIEIPGLGRRKRESLARWAAGVRRKFRYDPKQPLQPAVLSALARREAAERSVLERHLRGGPLALARDAEAARKELERGTERLAEAAGALAQAHADYSIIARL
jgi:DNA-binding helix-hairpin-helix protein with protein kinase domain